MKRTPLRKISSTRKTKHKRDLMPARVKRAKNKLYDLSHTYIRKRDSAQSGIIAGYCCSCGAFCEGGNFQAGHYEPDATGGALLRYHPHNMHGQGGYCCNITRNHKETVKVKYASFMYNKYGHEYVEKLLSMKKKSIKADIIFYEKMIELYEQGDELEIVQYLESLAGM